MNTYEPEGTTDRRSSMPGTTSCSRPTTNCRSGASASGAATRPPSMDAILGGWRVSGIFQARAGFPITVTDGRNRSLQGTRGNERPNCVGDPAPSDQNIDHWLDINAFAPCRWARWATADRSRPCAGLQEHRPDPGQAVRRRRRTRTFEVPRRGIQPDEHAELRPAGARHLERRTRSARSPSTVSTARTVELVAKFYF